MIRPNAIYQGKYCCNGEYMTYKSILTDANHLYNAYHKCIDNIVWKESTQRFMINHLRNIFSLQDDLIDEVYSTGKTNEFILTERGRIRPITGLELRDRIVRHVLCDDIFLPEIRKKIIYDNGASLKDRGISFSRKRFEVHLHRYYREYGNEGYILFGDFSKFYDNIIHQIAKKQLLELVDNDKYIDWLLTIIFKGFELDVSYMTDEEFSNIIFTVFNKLIHREVPKTRLTGNKILEKSVDVGDQLSQLIGIYYPNRIDTYVKYVASQKYYGRYMDDWYIISNSKEELHTLLQDIINIASELGIHINRKKTYIAKVNSTYTYLQVKYQLADNGRIIKRINPERVTAMRRKLKKLAIKYKNGDIEYYHIADMFKSWMGSFYKLLSKQQRRNLISLFEFLFDKNIQIVNKKMIIT